MTFSNNKGMWKIEILVLLSFTTCMINITQLSLTKSLFAVAQSMNLLKKRKIVPSTENKGIEAARSTNLSDGVNILQFLCDYIRYHFREYKPFFGSFVLLQNQIKKHTWRGVLVEKGRPVDLGNSKSNTKRGSCS
ncbi:hypothetical protein Cni_G07018 [Canna indica]|uniref:Uncharacterized protein n=1 Tax=Canna indica TaxID=4628 RepID=A0AAQ3JZL6_9LILI|nr:hypothetical protein Cni_G07018 [Canna indica]